MGLIFNIQRFCLHDGDGIRTCVFFKGCPLRCIWCHNPEGLEKKPSISFNSDKCSLCGRCLDVCAIRKKENNRIVFSHNECSVCGKCSDICINGANEIIGKEMTASEVMEEVLKDKIFYETSGGGLTLSGGEPSYQPEFALELISLAVSKGISVNIETCGIGSRDFYEKAFELGAAFLYDIKCIDSDLHRKLTGADNSQIISNINYLMDKGADIIIRLPMIPDCNDSDDDIALLSRFLTENKNRYRYAELMPYHSLGTRKAENLGTLSSYIRTNATPEEISRWHSLLASQNIDIRISE